MVVGSASGRPGEHGTVAVLVERVPVWRCPDAEADGHDAAASEPAPAPPQREALRRGALEGLPVASRGRPRRPERCSACRTALTLPGRRTQRSVSVVLEDAGVVTVTFDVPMLRCPGCAMEQLPRRAAADAGGALDTALASG